MKICDSINILNIDCLDLMKAAKDNAFDLAIVDPPYGIGESSKNHKSRNYPVKQKNGASLSIKDKEFKVLRTYEASELIGAAYESLFPYFENLGQEGAFRIFEADFVSTTDGTGIVHMAPAFGEDDYNTLKAAGVESVACHIDDEGKFLAEIAPYAGLYIKDADKEILRDLKERGLVYSHETCVHSYPFCPRSDTPLILVFA